MWWFKKGNTKFVYYKRSSNQFKLNSEFLKLFCRNSAFRFKCFFTKINKITSLSIAIKRLNNLWLVIENKKFSLAIRTTWWVNHDNFIKIQKKFIAS